MFIKYKYLYLCNETNKQKQIIMESLEIRTARIEFSKEDISQLMESGAMAITNTVNGLLDCTYNFKGFHEFTFRNNGKEITFNEVQNAEIFLQFQYSVG